MPLDNPPAFEGSAIAQDGVLLGAPRRPRQLLAVQTYGGHASIHDDATARDLGFRGGTIEGPTHFSQFAPLGYALWGERWLTNGCLSVHYRMPVFEGDAVEAFLKPLADAQDQAEAWMTREDGSEILRGTAAVGPNAPPSALDIRLGALAPLKDPVLLADVQVGRRAERQPVYVDFDADLGPMYPFTLRQKLATITEPSDWYRSSRTPWGRPILPMEMISVLIQSRFNEGDFGVRGPSVGLFADQEIRLLDGPVFVAEPYEIEREVLFLSGSRRTESMWVRSNLYSAGTDRLVATMLLNMATLKDSYAAYAAEYEVLYGASAPNAQSAAPA